MKIQINSLTALERLIGGDAQIEIEVRQSVAENFAKKYLKTLANDKIIEASSRTFAKAVGEEFFSSNHGGTYLKPAHYEAIRTVVQLEMSKHAQVLTQTEEFTKKMNEFINEQADRITAAFTDANIESRINAAADRKIKERLGIK